MSFNSHVPNRRHLVPPMSYHPQTVASWYPPYQLSDSIHTMSWFGTPHFAMTLGARFRHMRATSRRRAALSHSSAPSSPPSAPPPPPRLIQVVVVQPALVALLDEGLRAAGHGHDVRLKQLASSRFEATTPTRPSTSVRTLPTCHYRRGSVPAPVDRCRRIARGGTQACSLYRLARGPPPGEAHRVATLKHTQTFAYVPACQGLNLLEVGATPQTVEGWRGQCVRAEVCVAQ
jgi:hypothetical protein